MCIKVTLLQSQKQYMYHLSKHIVQKTLKVSEARYFGEISKVSSELIREFSLSDNAASFNKMVINGCLFISNIKINKRSDNTFVHLVDGSYGNIANFIVDKETKKELLLLQTLKIRPVFRNHHKFYQKVVDVTDDISIRNVSEIYTICVYIVINDESFICSVPNVVSY